MVSPNYLATLFKFFNETLPVLSSSNNLKAFRISSLGSLSAIFPVINSIKSANSITPLPYLSTSEIIFFTSSFLGSKPRALIATLSYLASMYPNSSNMYRHHQYQINQKLLLFIAFVIKLASFEPCGLASEEPFLFWMWTSIFKLLKDYSKHLN